MLRYTYTACLLTNYLHLYMVPIPIIYNTSYTMLCHSRLVQQTMPLLSSYNSNLVTWTVASMTAVKLKPLTHVLHLISPCPVFRTSVFRDSAWLLLAGWKFYNAVTKIRHIQITIRCPHWASCRLCGRPCCVRVVNSRRDILPQIPRYCRPNECFTEN